MGVDYKLKICQSLIYTRHEHKYTHMPGESDGKITITMSVLMLKPMASQNLFFFIVRRALQG